MDTDHERIDVLSKRIAHLRKAYAKGLGRKATTLEAAAINRAAMLTAKAEAAGCDANCSPNDVVRLDNAAARARLAMSAALKRKPPPMKSLQEYEREALERRAATA